MVDTNESTGIDIESARPVDVAAAEFLLCLKVQPEDQVEVWEHLVAGGFIEMDSSDGVLKPVCDVDAVLGLYRHESGVDLPRGVPADRAIADVVVSNYQHAEKADLIAAAEERLLAANPGMSFDEVHDEINSQLAGNSDLASEVAKVGSVPYQSEQFGDLWRPEEFRKSPAKYVKKVMDDGQSLGYRAKMLAKKVALIISTVVAMGLGSLPMAADGANLFGFDVGFEAEEGSILGAAIEPVTEQVVRDANREIRRSLRPLPRGVVDNVARSYRESKKKERTSAKVEEKDPPSINEVLRARGKLKAAVAHLPAVVQDEILIDYLDIRPEGSFERGDFPSWVMGVSNQDVRVNGKSEVLRGELTAFFDDQDIWKARVGVVSALQEFEHDVQDQLIGDFRSNHIESDPRDQAFSKAVALQAQVDFDAALSPLPVAMQDQVVKDYLSGMMSVHGSGVPSPEAKSDQLGKAWMGVVTALEPLPPLAQNKVVANYGAERVAAFIQAHAGSAARNQGQLSAGIGN